MPEDKQEDCRALSIWQNCAILPFYLGHIGKILSRGDICFQSHEELWKRALQFPLWLTFEFNNTARSCTQRSVI